MNGILMLLLEILLLVFENSYEGVGFDLDSDNNNSSNNNSSNNNSSNNSSSAATLTASFVLALFAILFA